MPRWNESDLTEFLHRSSAGRAQDKPEVQGSKPQPASRYEPLAEAPRKESGKKRIRVVVTSMRCRLLDEDNLCPKYIIDILRYGGILRDDSPDLVKIEIRQEKVKTKDQEETIIEILP
jgi:hypothetical protein